MLEKFTWFTTDIVLLILYSGYMAPEYAMAGLFSVKSDVFSFGVLVLEIIYGKRNGDFFLSEHMQSLLLYVSFTYHISSTNWYLMEKEISSISCQK